MTDSPDRVEEFQLTIFSRLVECQRVSALKMDKLLDAGMQREWNQYQVMYWMVIHARLKYEAKLAKTIEANKEKDPDWSLSKYLNLDSAVSHP